MSVSVSWVGPKPGAEMPGVGECGIYMLTLENRLCCIFFDWKRRVWEKSRAQTEPSLKPGVSRKILLGDSNWDLPVKVG